jgi:hypothetical protein|tara:strand:+ start:339 stop:512 length:174 start_codon:yes stop_codon:yes gene_type:complete
MGMVFSYLYQVARDKKKKLKRRFRYGRSAKYERVDMMDYDSSDEDTFQENFKSTISL